MTPPAFSRLIGHDAPVERLESLVRRGRLAHAYLFTGPEGVGKRTAALAWACRLLCAGDGNDSCRECQQIDAGTHPHLLLLRREEGKQDISLEQIHSLLQSLSLKSTDPRPRIAILEEADHLNEEGMNTLLKTLEEPPPGSLFLLVTSRPAALLPTIHSRCHTVRFGPVPEEPLRAFLERSSPGSSPDAALAARLAGGSPGRALGLIPEIPRMRARLLEILGHLQRRDLPPILEELTRTRDAQKSRREAFLLIDLLLLTLREILRARLESRPVDPTLLPPENRLLRERTTDEIATLLDTVLEHREALERNANVSLVVENTLLQIDQGAAALPS